MKQSIELFGNFIQPLKPLSLPILLTPSNTESKAKFEGMTPRKQTGLALLLLFIVFVMGGALLGPLQIFSRATGAEVAGFVILLLFLALWTLKQLAYTNKTDTK